ncbi:hypothetical protein FA95DRAFT_108078 [Auriscalpium vulgare]|uniref:Uncharacterized protein n=1 Tax=Auriscalpium vulgare TaxID=40419 RepID=A0ACB8S759_9AGAM|nr:hypothetical protein FA95DRAFT_108078 [Auriscalpium vulgare]
MLGALRRTSQLMRRAHRVVPRVVSCTALQSTRTSSARPSCLLRRNPCSRIHRGQPSVQTHDDSLYVRRPMRPSGCLHRRLSTVLPWPATSWPPPPGARRFVNQTRQGQGTGTMPYCSCVQNNVQARAPSTTCASHNVRSHRT